MKTDYPEKLYSLKIENMDIEFFVGSESVKDYMQECVVEWEFYSNVKKGAIYKRVGDVKQWFYARDFKYLKDFDEYLIKPFFFDLTCGKSVAELILRLANEIKGLGSAL